MTQYKFSHLIIIIASVVMSVIGLLWVFHHYITSVYPNEEFYIILVMYVGMIVPTGFIFKTKNTLKIHRYIGLRPTQIQAIVFAIAVAFFIWGMDYFYQSEVLDIDIRIQARDWYENETSLILAFLGTVIFAPLIEEMLFRGIILQGLNTYLSRFWSAIILSAVFAAIHFDALQIPTLFFASLIYVWLTYKYNSIIPAIIAHVINNGLTYFYYLHLNGM